MVELDLLRSFVVVAETEHVGRAAELLHVSQSPLSRRIQRLEDELGLRLFDRVRRRIRLTAAGRWFLAESRALLAHAERLVRASGGMARGEVGSLGIGCVQSALWSRVLPAALRRFSKAHPGVSVNVRLMTSAAQVEALQQGSIDVGVGHVAPPGLDATRLAVESFVLAVPRGHRLARAPRIRPADVDGQPWVALSRTAHPRLAERLLAECARVGFAPDIRCEATDPLSLLALVEAGVGLALVQGSARRVAPGVVMRELPWFRFALTVYALRRVGGGSPLAAGLVEDLVAGSGKRRGKVARERGERPR